MCMHASMSVCVCVNATMAVGLSSDLPPVVHVGHLLKSTFTVGIVCE